MTPHAPAAPTPPFAHTPTTAREPSDGVRPGRRQTAAGCRAAVTLVLVALVAAPAAHAGKAHQHGVARLDVAVEGGQLSFELDTPLDNLLGFERAPRTAAERQRVEAMATRLKQPGTLFLPDAAAGCTPGPVELTSPVLGLGTAAATTAAGTGAGAAKPAHDHADLSARFAFTCTQPEALRQVEVGLFKAFSGFKRIETQVITPKGQARRSLTPAASRLALPE